MIQRETRIHGSHLKEMIKSYQDIKERLIETHVYAIREEIESFQKIKEPASSEIEDFLMKLRLLCDSLEQRTRGFTESSKR